MYYAGYIMASSMGVTLTKEVEPARLSGAKLASVLDVGQLAVSMLNKIKILNNTNDNIDQYCNRRSAYESINATNPSQFDSLQQYEKYLLEHPDAQIVLDERCPDQQKPVAHLPYGIFNAFYSKDLVTFTLCSPIPSAEPWGDEFCPINEQN